jgi:2-oxoglutarate ferredoxin oxidoreductase subunit delta
VLRKGVFRIQVWHSSLKDKSQDSEWAKQKAMAITRAVVTQVGKEQKNKRASKRFKVSIDEKLCKGCYFCVRFCPMGVFVRSNVVGELGYNLACVEHPEKCNRCKACLLYCPDLAVVVEEDEEAGGKE